MQVTEDSAASEAEQLAHGRSAVERWLAWSGLVPLPAFLLLHLGRELALAFATDVSQVLRPAPSALSLLSSAVLVWLPLAIHLGLGGWFLLVGQKLSAPAADVPALPRLVSRITGAVALLFVLYHVRTYPLAVWLDDGDARDAGFRLIAQLSSTSFGVPLVGAAYLLGSLATVAHASLAVHRALLAEGLLSSASRRLLSARACTAFGALLALVGAAAVIRVASGVLLR